MPEGIKGIYLWVGVVALLLAGHITAIAQPVTVRGQVIDFVSDEPVPFANIYFIGNTNGTTSDFDGYYKINLLSKPDSIVISALGYKTVTKPVTAEANQVINFKLQRDSYNLGEVVVVPGENPADTFMRQIIKHKPKNSKENLNSYSYEAYNKVELDLYDIEDLKDRKVMKPFQFIFDKVDSTSEEVPYLPAFLSETLSDYYYRKQPKQEQEVIKASRISGVENESVTQFMGSLYQEVDIYNNWVGLLEKEFVSPISDVALNYYNFYMVDSSYIDGYWCYKLSFKPKNKGSFTFLGDMWVTDEDNNFAVKKVDMQVADHVNINFVERSSVSQQFVQTADSSWMLLKDKIVIKFKVVDKAVGIIGRKTTTIDDLVINNPAIDTVFNGRQDILVNKDVMVTSEEFWRQHRHVPLSQSEMGIYEMVDSLENTKAFRTWVDIIDLVFTGYYEVGWFEFGPYGSVVSLNRVERFRFSLGFRTTSNFSERFRVGAYGAYGVKDDRWKYGFSGMAYIIKNPRLIIGGEYKHDLDLQGTNEADISQDNLLANLVRRQKVPLRLNLMREWTAYLEKEWPLGFSARVGFSNKQYMPQFDYYYIPGEDDNYPEPVITNFTNTEVSLRLRFAFKEKFVEGAFDRVSLGTELPILIVRYGYGIPDILKSGFEYHRVDVWLMDEFPISPLGRFNYTLKAGKVFGRLPTQLLEVHPGNETYFYSDNAFSLMNRYEFTSDQYVSLMIRHHFDGFFFNKIPGIRKLKWRSLVTVKAVWGTMTEENKAANDLNVFKIPSKVPYIEYGFGIENIFKVIRVDFVWRATYRDDPRHMHTPNFGVLLGLEINL